MARARLGIFRSACHMFREFRAALAHFFRWIPIRPLDLAADLMGAGPFEPILGRRDTVLHGASTTQNVIKRLCVWLTMTIVPFS